jgi:hypothetical protein
VSRETEGLTEDLLRDRLVEIARRISVPAGLGLQAHQRWRHGRRTRRFRRALLGGAAVATAGVLALTLTGGTPAGRLGPAERSSAYVTRHVDGALSAANSARLVQYTTTELPAGSGAPVDPPYIGAWNNPRNTRPVFREWNYQGQYASTFYGRPGDEIFAGRGVTGRRQVTSTFVTYLNHTWWREVQPVDPPVPSDWCYGGPDGWISNWTPVVRSLLACRNVVVNNTPGRIDGQDAIELSQWAPRLGTWYLWVNPVSYLPIRLITVAPNHFTVAMAFQWLRPTPANLAPFQLTVPRGYRRVPFPVG